MIERQSLGGNVGRLIVCLLGTVDRLSQSIPVTHDPTVIHFVTSTLATGETVLTRPTHVGQTRPENLACA